MSAVNLPREFVGRTSAYYKDGETVYIYDAITHGLYRFILTQRKVTLVLSPLNLHWKTKDRIMGISKRGNELILIPFHLNSNWIFYDVEKEEIRYFSPIKNEIKIAEVITIGCTLFLVPFDTDNPIVLLSLEHMEKIRVYEDWCPPNQEKIKDRKYIWGASSNHDLVIFPVINSNCIVWSDMEGIHTITLDIPALILAAAIYEDRIWILPASGEYIYETDLNGKITDRIDLVQVGYVITASDFNRIVITKENIFLFPVQGSDLYVYQHKVKKFIRIKIQEEFLFGKLFFQSLTSYWHFIIEKEKLHLLPSAYPYKSIELLSLEEIDHGLTWEEDGCQTTYWEIVRCVNKDCIFNEQKDSLEEFIQIVVSSGKQDLIKNDGYGTEEITGSTIGKLLYGKLKEL